MGTVVTNAPLIASEIAMTLLRQPLNSRWCARSIASPVGASQPARDHCRFTRIAAASISATEFLSSRFTNSFPSPEDKNSVAEIDAAAMRVKRQWSLAGCEAPTGLAIDRAHHLLFSGCRNRSEER